MKYIMKFAEILKVNLLSSYMAAQAVAAALRNVVFLTQTFIASY